MTTLVRPFAILTALSTLLAATFAADESPAFVAAITEKTAIDDYPVKPVPFTAVHLHDVFWSPRIETNRTVTIPFAFKKCEETGRVWNFERAAAALRGEEVADKTPPGFPFDDTDIYKIIEGASYCLTVQPDPALDAYIDSLIAKIAAAQEPDGYLYPARTLAPDAPHPWAGKERWVLETDLSHELYNLGHLYEAAVAHYQATGKRSLLDIAIKTADLLDQTFGPDKRTIWPGHQIVEMGLVKLYRITGDVRYFKLAKFMLDARGPGDLPRAGSEYNQSKARVVDQTTAMGHAVRATYMYAGMADVAALTGDADYLQALTAIWRDVVSTKLHITGGIGARHAGEAFGEPYELPNLTAYNETCAAIGNDYWNHRMFLLTGDARFVDVLERTLYNGVLSGVSLDGKGFFYPNPLESFGEYERSAWFGCACCPGNITRFLASVPGYVYAMRGDTVFANLYAAGTGSVRLEDGRVIQLTQETRYPWEGAVKFTLTPPAEGSGEFTLALRIPGWARGEVVPGGLYQFADENHDAATISVNGETVPLVVDKGFATVRRAWKAGDVVTLELPMPVRRVAARPEVEADRRRVALQRGPIIFALEGPDNPGGEVLNTMLADDAPLTAAFRPDLLGGVVTISGKVTRARRSASGGVQREDGAFTAIPYATWANRGPAEMLVWIPRDRATTWVRPAPTIASTSKVAASGGETLRAAQDQAPVANSRDESHKFTRVSTAGGAAAAWIEYTFAKPTRVSKAAAYWFDSPYPWARDLPPKSWRVLYRDGDAWKPVQTKDTPGIALDTFNRITFTPVTTAALRLELTPQDGAAVGLLEWTVE
ncbi:MAG: glycoside hydrolase family 127 protein [Opitutaceae bacterium]|nr:glycoside hydrolase family 127 protein [Opitutaceae bacterium]